MPVAAAVVVTTTGYRSQSISHIALHACRMLSRLSQHACKLPRLFCPCLPWHIWASAAFVFLPSFNCVVAIIAPTIPIIAHIHDSSGSSTSVQIRNCPIDYWRLTAIKHEVWDTYFLSFFFHSIFHSSYPIFFFVHQANEA